MIKADFYLNTDGSYRGFSVSGHAGYAKRGQDIVCASVSSLVINTVNAIEALKAQTGTSTDLWNAQKAAG